MKNLVICLLIVSGVVTTGYAQGRTFYIAGNGNDQNSGTSARTPFKTLAKVNSIVLGPGDVLNFKRGDTFRGMLTIKQSGTSTSPIVIDAYGTGPQPIISGATVVKGWEKMQGNVWQASCPECGDQVSGLYLDTVALPLGRYPKLTDEDNGYLTVQSHSGVAQLTSKDPVERNWVGGEVVYRPMEWIIDKREIVGQSGNTFTLAAPPHESSTYEIHDNWGYFIQNHPATLTENGEWCYDKAHKTIMVYFNNIDPNERSVAVTTSSRTVDLENASFIHIQNVEISQGLVNNFYANNTSNLTIESSSITDGGDNGIMIVGVGTDVIITHNVIKNINNNGIEVHGITNFVFSQNVVENVSMLPGMGKSGEHQYFGFQYYNEDGHAMIERNIFRKMGFIGISFYGSNITVQHNLVTEFDQIKSDGGGIYTYKAGADLSKTRTNQKILGNIVVNSKGPKGGSVLNKFNWNNAVGIYLDDCSENIDISGNTVANCAGPAVEMHGTTGINLSGNTFYNNSAQYFMNNDWHVCNESDNTITNNVFFNLKANQVFARYFQVSKGDISTFGKIDNNTYYSAVDNPAAFDQNLYNNGGDHFLAFKDWSNKFGKDVSSTSTSLHLPARAVTKDKVLFEYNMSNSPWAAKLNGTYSDVNNKTYQGSITIAPYSSVILIKQN